MTERRKNSSKVRGLHKAADIAYNEQAGGLKVVGPILGKIKRLFATGITTDNPLPAGVTSGAVIAFYNPNATTAWLILHEGAGPTGTPSDTEATSIALKPNDYTVLALSSSVSIIKTDVNVIAYLVEDDSTFSKG
jgi:hypothetical protein